MIPPPSPVHQHLDCLLGGEIPIAEFEQWVYASSELEQVVGSGEYLELLAFDYGQAHADLALEKLVQAIYDRARPGMLLRNRAYRYASGLVNRSMPVHQAVHGLANLWHTGYEQVWAEFAGISSDFDGLPTPEEEDLWHPIARVRYRHEWDTRRQRLDEHASSVAREFLLRDYPGWPAAKWSTAGAGGSGITQE